MQASANTPFDQTFTITFGDQAENHAGMQKIGRALESGFNKKDLLNASRYFSDYQTELIKLHDYLADDDIEEDLSIEKAYLLIIRSGINKLVPADQFFLEQSELTKDTKAYMHGRVVNKLARHNLCFADFSQKADFGKGRGTIINFADVPLLSRVRNELPAIIGEKAKNCVAEGNYYYNPEKCGIGFHGDSERKIVIATRIGQTLPLHYQWFHRSRPVGQRIKLLINHGDIYIMSEKAVGFDWKKRKIYTLRHAAGSKKYLTIKEK